MDEGYTGYLCSVSDDARGEGKYTQNRIDNKNIADFYGMKDSFEFLMPHHQMDSVGIQDLKQRFIFLIRCVRFLLSLLRQSFSQVLKSDILFDF